MLNRKIFLSLLILAIFVHSSVPARAIMGGTDATNNPIVVGILQSEKANLSGCSGALVAPRIVFTAAHCLFGDPSSRWIAQPGSNLGNLDTLRIQAEKFFVPKDFSTANFPYQNDFGIIVLKSGFEMNSKVDFASISEIEQWTNSEESVSHIGYGCTALVEKPPCMKTSQTPNQLVTTLQKTVPLEFLNLKPQTFSMTKISVTKTICGGDSGSPLLINRNGTWIYIGAQSSSNGAGCTPTCNSICVATQGLPAANLDLVKEAYGFVNPVPVVQKQTQKVVSIICTKGRSVKTISGVKPLCPQGYKRK